MTARALAIHLPGRLVGRLGLTPEGRARWLPDEAWEREGQHPRLGVDFLRRPGRRAPVPGVPRWFENLLPEAGSELRRRACAAFALREGQSYALLRALGADLIGAVRALPTASGPDEVGQDEDVADRESPPPSAEAPPRGLSALTGMQLKLSMSMIEHRLAMPVHGADGQWIVKLAGTEFRGLAAVEMVTMTWARLAGFDVPEHRRVSVADLVDFPFEAEGHEDEAYAVRRFDRRDDGTRIHQEDLCQALDLAPSNKNGWWPVVTFDGALRFVTDVCGEDEGREMARRMGFCIAAGNGDAHLKNWSLSWGERARPVLTPCYDLVSTISFERLGWTGADGPSLALRLGGARHFRQLDGECLSRLCDHSRQPWAADEIRSGIARAQSAWRHVASEAPPAMRAALGVHVAEVPILRHS